MRAAAVAFVALAASGCSKLSTEGQCKAFDLAQCQAHLTECEPVTACAGPSPLCADPNQCKAFDCQPAGPGMCLKTREEPDGYAECTTGRTDDTFRCVRVDPSPCPHPRQRRLEDGGTLAFCLEFECGKSPNPCEGCALSLVRCAGRPTPLFGR